MLIPKNMVRWPLLSAALILLSALLASCAQGEAHVTIHRNGTADLDLSASVSRRTLELIGQPDLPKQLSDILQRNGMAAAVEDDGSQTGIRATRHLNLKDMADRPITLPEGMELEQSTERKFFYTRYHVAVTMDMVRLLRGSGEGNDWSQSIASMPALAKKLVERQMDLDFLLTFPIKPGANNADEIQDRGRTLVWHLNLFSDNRFETSLAVPNVRHIAYTAGPALLLLTAGIVIAIVRARRRGRRTR
ncbi:hypothetical protein COLU111180_15540 [Cohnella lubricantis]|uniref:DUF3153 domain-containing protein n=1 Tax=Cohnella lubricantis TaxID=2163172 RepID=A0A841TFU1_9BACL|nr:hypothetical protein [Cohnella lubricantis]MBB6678148.1 hypothetical protein [Cohnella lubricantis]MBP2120640.1 hypothetical protein [Cohnella lubricantis]